MFDGFFDPLEVASCIGCGCTDDAACQEGCYWLMVDRDLSRGVCSCCPGARARFRDLVAGRQPTPLHSRPSASPRAHRGRTSGKPSPRRV
jgi:hypothetical protein